MNLLSFFPAVHPVPGFKIAARSDDKQEVEAVGDLHNEFGRPLNQYQALKPIPGLNQYKVYTN